MNSFKKREFFAYQPLKGERIYKNGSSNLNDLLVLLKKKNNSFFIEFKIWIVLMLRWEFDYLTHYLQDPQKLKNTIKQIYILTGIFLNLSKSNWINNLKIKKLKLDNWQKTRKSFDFMWNRTTKGDFQKLSEKMIEPRVKQIVRMLPKNFLKKSIILDSGCGTGRYIEMYKKYHPKKIVGLDIGKNIIKNNKKKFKNKKNISFVRRNINNLQFSKNIFDFINSAGVLHHSEESMANLIKEHCRVLKKNGYMFIFITSSSGLHLDLLKFSRELLKDIPIKTAYDFLKNKINPLRIQGILDFSYGEYKKTKRKEFEKILKRNFSSIKRVKGVLGCDCTPELYKKDRYFKLRFGEGDLRYLCKK